VAIPADRNVVQKETEKKLKCKSLCIEIHWMWNPKCKILPVINWSHWSSNKMFKEKFGSHTRKHSVDSLQKTTILETLHTIPRVLQSETWRLSGGDHRWFKRSTRKSPVTGNKTKQIKTKTTTTTTTTTTTNNLLTGWLAEQGTHVFSCRLCGWCYFQTIWEVLNVLVFRCR